MRTSRLFCCLSGGVNTLDDDWPPSAPLPLCPLSSMQSKLASKADLVCKDDWSDIDGSPIKAQHLPVTPSPSSPSVQLSRASSGASTIKGPKDASGHLSASEPSSPVSPCQADCDMGCSGGLDSQPAACALDALAPEQPSVAAKRAGSFPGFRVAPACMPADPLSPGHAVPCLHAPITNASRLDSELSCISTSSRDGGASASCSYDPVCETSLRSWLGESVDAIPESAFQPSLYLGHGAFGRVWLADCPALGCSAAVKKMRRSAWGSIGLLADEICAQYSLRHPNIVACLAVVDSQGQLVGMALENMAGGSLALLLRHFPSGLPLAICIQLGLQIAEALSFSHRNGIVHSDLKPENVLLEGNMRLAKLADFGLALKEHEDGSLWDAEAGRGTPNYWAPELAGGDALIGSAVDLWALGMVLFEMATGHTPFDGFSEPQICQALVSSGASATLLATPAPPGTDAGLHAYYMELVSRCCEVDPDCRPSAHVAVMWLTELVQCSHLTVALSSTTLPPVPAMGWMKSRPSSSQPQTPTAVQDQHGIAAKKAGRGYIENTGRVPRRDQQAAASQGGRSVPATSITHLTRGIGTTAHRLRSLASRSHAQPQAKGTTPANAQKAVAQSQPETLQNLKAQARQEQRIISTKARTYQQSREAEQRLLSDTQWQWWFDDEKHASLVGPIFSPQLASMLHRGTITMSTGGYREATGTHHAIAPLASTTKPLKLLVGVLGTRTARDVPASTSKTATQAGKTVATAHQRQGAMALPQQAPARNFLSYKAAVTCKGRHLHDSQDSPRIGAIYGADAAGAAPDADAIPAEAPAQPAEEEEADLRRPAASLSRPAIGGPSFTDWRSRQYARPHIQNGSVACTATTPMGLSSACGGIWAAGDVVHQAAGDWDAPLYELFSGMPGRMRAVKVQPHWR
ncbi:hypothetical protein WJX72_003566 [[Myrmecia] bisecta]|uniref:Protein kinase domain-containing protein n=1 Tax=[Myrmecia] bisecta TaxID=41462 RepID=A0AAW1PBC4_9CHLO